MQAHQPWIRYFVCVWVCKLARWKMANNRNEWWRARRSNLDIVYFVARVVNLTAAPSLSSGFSIHTNTDTHTDEGSQAATVRREEIHTQKRKGKKKRTNELRLQLGVVVIPFAFSVHATIFK